MPTVEPQSLSDNVKFQHIHSFPRVHREWTKGDLTREEKREILDGMEIAVTESWLLTLIEDIRDARKSREN